MKIFITLLLLLSISTAQSQVMSGEGSLAAQATIYSDTQARNGGGYEGEFCIGSVGPRLRRGFARFDLPDIPRGSTVTRVMLGLEQNRIRQMGPNTPKEATLRAQRVTSPWIQGTAREEINPGVDGRACGFRWELADHGDSVSWDNAPDVLENDSALWRLPLAIRHQFIIDTNDGDENDALLEDVQAWVNGAGNHGWMFSVVEEAALDNARLMMLLSLSVEWNETTATSFTINPGLNDAWYNKLTDGQGIFIIVYPDIQLIFIAWFTYEAGTQDGAMPKLNAVLGDDEHRWLTAAGFYEEGDASAELDITITRGGKFDAGDEVSRDTDGTITLTFEHCDKVVAEYDIPSIERSGSVDLERVAKDNVGLCEALAQAGNESKE